MSTAIHVLIIAMCILIQGFFSGSEMVILSCNRLKLRKKSKTSKGAKLALTILHNQRWYLASTTTGTNMLVIISSVIAAVWFEHKFGESGELLTILIISPIVLMFGEIIPRTVFQQKADELAPKVAYPLMLASRIIAPVTFLIFRISKLFYGKVGKEDVARHPLITREELQLALNIPSEQSDVRKTERKLIHRVFHLSKSQAEDVMVPLIRVTAVSDTATIRETVKKVNQTGYSRLPVYQNRIDNLIGIVNAFDLIAVPDGYSPVGKFIREVPFVPEFKRAHDLLIMLQKTRNSIAIVVNEYGGAVGIVTIEDILEEVVGEIRDEYDREVRQIVQIGLNRYLVSARMEIDQINERLKVNLPKQDYDTIGGFLLKFTGKIPQRGETFTYKNIKFAIRKASRRSVHEIIVEILDTKFHDQGEG